MDFSKWTCRASKLGTIMTGKIGITDNQESELAGYEEKLRSGKALTARQAGIYADLTTKKLHPELPKTVQSELRDVYRQVKFGREFMFTNKYLQKGIFEEEASITVISRFLGKPLVRYKGDRMHNDHFQGHPDIVLKDFGIDAKSVWSLQTLPFGDEELDSIYEWQNQCYMDLFGKEKWITAKVLVNANGPILMNEINKFWYASGQPEISDPEWIELAKKIERNMIFDMGLFLRDNPSYSMLYHSQDEWEFDIPMEERIILFESFRDEEKLEDARERVKMCRSYLKNLQEKFG
jgi:hypothetical protein